MHVHACTLQKLHVCVATASRGHANLTCVTRVRHACHMRDTHGPFKLWVICTVYIYNLCMCICSYAIIYVRIYVYKYIAKYACVCLYVCYIYVTRFAKRHLVHAQFQDTLFIAI